MADARKTWSEINTSLVCISFGIGLLVITLVRSLYYAPEKEMPIPNEASLFPAQVQNEKDFKILIPKIGVDTHIEQVGITYKGNMSTPKKVSNVGWYKYGTFPGKVGSAVIDGHVDNGLGLPGIFSNLKDLRSGDNIYIKTEDAEVLHFVVFDVQKYQYDEVPLEVIFNRNDGTYLNLITCDGVWVPELETNDARIIVFAKLST